MRGVMVSFWVCEGEGFGGEVVAVGADAEVCHLVTVSHNESSK